MQLTRLLTRLQPLAVSGEVDGCAVSCVVFNSKKAVPGCLFVAVRGTQADGHDYIDQAIAAGAVAVVAEDFSGADAGAGRVGGATGTLSPGPSPEERGDGSGGTGVTGTLSPGPSPEERGDGSGVTGATGTLSPGPSPEERGDGSGVTGATGTLSPGPSPGERGDGSGVTGVTDASLADGEITDVYWEVPFPQSSIILGYAKKMRSNPTPAEKLLWESVRANKIGHKVYRQKPMGYSIADFIFPNKRVLVEVDGGYHESPEMYWSDAERDRKFEAVGYKVLRFTNEQVLAGPLKVAADIKSVLDTREDRPFPYPKEIYYGTPTPITPSTSEPSPLSPGEGPGERVTPTSEPSPLSRGEEPGERVIRITVPDSAKALAHLAEEFNHNPSQDLTLVGITGTNGKTTVATLLHDLFTQLGYKAGLLSTVELRIASRVRAATHTTPDAVAISETLAEMRDAGCAYVFMEVSSHAVAQQRTAGLTFSGGVFTNLSHDHLDYHETFAAYRDVKKAFFDQLPKTAFALTNADDKNGAFMLQNTKARKLKYSLRQLVDYRAKVMSSSVQGLQLELDGTEVFTRFIGRFNAYNLVAAFGVAMELGQERDEVLVALSSLTAAAGRLDYVTDPAGRITAVVDYAHTPDALENVLTTLADLLAPDARLLCVVGAGGDRDRSKRPVMARLAARLADQTILTSDNPRGEDPEAILNEMQAGLDTPALQAKTLRITDRRSAIRTAIQLARPQDIVLVAGKGHETYQEIKGERFPFDDKLELTNALNALSHVG